MLRALCGLLAAAALLRRAPREGSFISTRVADDPGHVHVLPTYPQYHHPTEQLDGYWRYAFSADAYPAAPEPQSKTWVPEALPTTSDSAPPRGFALFERDLAVLPGHAGRLQFYGCAFHCIVQVDGQEVARHDGGYTVFYADVPGTGRNHTLRVLVDSRLDANGAGGLNQPKYDFMQYGGLLRPVVLHAVPGGAAMLEGVDVLQRPNGSTALRFRLHRFGPGKEPLDVEVSSDYLRQPVQLRVDEEHLEHEVALAGPRWSPASPSLAVVHAKTATATGLSVRTGLRSVAACEDRGDARVCLDGKPVKLLGFCMHNLDAHYRQTVPREAIKKDLEEARAAGANFLRLVHYPHDALTLELADELGLLLWAETLGWGNSLADLTDASFHAAQLQMLDEAVPTTFNHPSVVLYGFLNEGENADARACPLYRDLAERYRGHWRVNGLVTWASNTYQGDQCLAEADVVSFNTYPGWYSGLDQAPSTSVPAEFARLAGWAREAWPKKPLVIAEVGAAAIPASVPFTVPAGPHARGGDIGHWSEAYQASVDAAAAEAAVCDGRVAGVSIWQLFDTRTGEERQVSRPRGFNNKGVVRENGIEKASFAAVRDAFTRPCAVLP